MPIIDCHVHLYPPAVNQAAVEWAAAAGESVWAALCTRRRKDGRPVQGFPDTDALLGAMDAAGVDRAVLLGWYWQTPAACVLQNRFFAECIRRYPDRLSACVTVQPADVASARDELRWARDHGFLGVGELSPHSTALAHDDPGWHEVLALAGELRLPVTLHVTDPDSRKYAGRVETPLEHFLAWARRHDQTTFILAHGGGRLPWRFRDAVTLNNVYYDTAAFPLLYPAADIRSWIEHFGAERLLWGTDWPLDLYPRSEHRPTMVGFRSEVEELNLPAEVVTRLLGQNAAQLYQLR